MADRELTAVCQYDTRVFDRRWVAAACQAHPAGPASPSPLRHRLQDDGRTLAFSGEADLANAGAFAAMLRRLRPGGTLDITGMTFLDARALAEIARTARENAGLRIRAGRTHLHLLDLIRDAGVRHE